jgi:hypothetical protein
MGRIPSLTMLTRTKKQVSHSFFKFVHQAFLTSYARKHGAKEGMPYTHYLLFLLRQVLDIERKLTICLPVLTLDPLKSCVS